MPPKFNPTQANVSPPLEVTGAELLVACMPVSTNQATGTFLNSAIPRRHRNNQLGMRLKSEQTVSTIVTDHHVDYNIKTNGDRLFYHNSYHLETSLDFILPLNEEHETNIQ